MFSFGNFRFSPLKVINNVLHNGAKRNDPNLPEKSSNGSAYCEKNIWHPDFVEALQNNPKESTNISQVDELKNMVRDMFDNISVGLASKLVLIDDLERLGLGYHFEKEIKKALGTAFSVSEDACTENDLYLTALYFRLLRQHGYKISQDMFRHLKDEDGNFRLSLCEDVKGMISLYEASQLCLEGENILEEAKEFTVKHLSLLKECKDPRLAKEVTRALELPLHWRMPRLEARCYIDTYEKKENMNPIILQLAKLDFNLLQSIHRNELSNLSRWWKNLGLSDKLSSRDRLVESYLWSVGLVYKPQYQCCREWLTKVVCLVITVDDMYDIYGLLSDLETFTSAVERYVTTFLQV